MAAGEFRGQRMARQIGRQMRAHGNRPHTRPTPAVRNAERLVQIEVAHVAAELSRPGHTHQGVEVGAVHVDLAAGVVHRRTDIGDVVLEDTVGRRIGDHQRRQRPGMLGDLCAQFVKVDVTVVAAANHHHAHADQGGRRSVGAVRTRRDQAHIAVRLAAPGVVVADREQAGVLALGPGIGLQ